MALIMKELVQVQQRELSFKFCKNKKNNFRSSNF